MDEGGNERTQLYVLERGARAARRRSALHPPVAARCAGGARVLDEPPKRRRLRRRRARSRDRRRAELGAGWNCSVEALSPDGRWIAVDRVGDRSGDNDLLLVDTRPARSTHRHAARRRGGVPLDPSGSAAAAFFAATNAGRDTFAIARPAAAMSGRASRSGISTASADEAGRHLLAVANEDGYSRLTLLDPQTFAVRERCRCRARRRRPSGVLTGRLAARVLVLEPGRAARRLPLRHRREELSRLTTSPRQVDPATLVEPTLHRFESFDGESVPVFLFEPKATARSPSSSPCTAAPSRSGCRGSRPSFAPLTQYLVSRGYAVAAPNVRGSTGYGKRYQCARRRRRSLDSVRDLARCTSGSARARRSTASRAVVYGRSYGGYMVLAALAFQPERWAAGIECVGISSLVTSSRTRRTTAAPRASASTARSRTTATSSSTRRR